MLLCSPEPEVLLGMEVMFQKASFPLSVDFQ